MVVVVPLTNHGASATFLSDLAGHYVHPMAPDDSAGSVLHQQALTVMGFFGGLTLTALVLILNSPAEFHKGIGPVTGSMYFQLVTTYVAGVGAISTIGLVAFLEVGSGMLPKFSRVDQYATGLFLVSVFGFMGILPVLLLPYTPGGALGILVIEVVLLVTYFVLRRDPTVRPPAIFGQAGRRP